MYQVLVVDDENSVRYTYGEFIRDAGYKIFTAENAFEALTILNKNSPIAVALVDMVMPKMDGFQLISRIRDEFPNTVSIMMTGFGDLNSAMRAINDGNVFRFITKPCKKIDLVRMIHEGIKQYKLIVSEKELLEKTLKGSINILTEILSMVDMETFGQSVKLREVTKKLAALLHAKNMWQIELAALLCQLGTVTLPEHLRQKARYQETLTDEENKMLTEAPEIAYRLINHIPRMENVANIVRYQLKEYNGGGPPEGDVSGDAIPEGARILKALQDLSAIQADGTPFAEAIEQMSRQDWKYDPKIFNIIRQYELQMNSQSETDTAFEKLQVDTYAVKINDTFLSDVLTLNQKLLLKSGSQVTQAIFEKLCNYHTLIGIQEPLTVLRNKEPEDN